MYMWSLHTCVRVCMYVRVSVRACVCVCVCVCVCDMHARVLTFAICASVHTCVTIIVY